MIKAPTGGADLIQVNVPTPKVPKAQPENGADFKQAFESAKESVSKAETGTKEVKTDGTGANGKDSKAADQTADNSKVKTDNDKTAVKKDDPVSVSDTKEVSKAEPASRENVDTKATGEEEMTDVAEISKIAEKLIMDIAALLGISPEELQNTLNAMNIDTSDLLVSENINILVADVKGGGDMISLAADSALADIAAEINRLAEEVSTQIKEVAAAIAPEDMKAAFDEAMTRFTAATETAVKEKTEDIKAETVVTADVAEGTEENVKAADMTVTKVTEVSGKENEAETQTESGNSGNTEKRELRPEHEWREDMNVSRFDMTAEVKADPELIRSADDALMQYGTNTREVVEQIMDHMRAQVKVDMSSMEMVLHPASLGSVAVNIASNGGNVTAQFTVQNEVVREAIEAQIVIFKENLEQQGVKVEAVEVAVASHGFEENLEQGNDRNDAEADEQERLRRATRRIDLGPFGEEGLEDIDEAEAVTVDMMRSDGNRMNYRV